MYFEKLSPETNGKEYPLRLIFLHGWGVDMNTLKPLANLFKNEAEVWLLDMPGFGKTPAPDKAWDTSDYAAAVAAFAQDLPQKTTVFIGHSFGGRVCIRLAAGFKKQVQGIILIAGAGLPLKHSFPFKIKAFFMRRFAKIAKKLPFFNKMQFGSRDYRAAKGIMRSIFVKTVNENLEQTAKEIECPVRLIYGEKDTAAPAYFGEIYKNSIPQAELSVLKNQDHFSLIIEGKRQTAFLIDSFLKEKYRSEA